MQPLSHKHSIFHFVWGIAHGFMQVLRVPRDLWKCPHCPETKENTLQSIPSQHLQAGNGFVAVTQAYVARNSGIPQGTLSRVDFSFIFSLGLTS